MPKPDAPSDIGSQIAHAWCDGETIVGRPEDLAALIRSHLKGHDRETITLALNAVADRLTTYPNQVSEICIELLRNWNVDGVAWIKDHDREVEARARLEEAKWWEHLVGAVNEGEECKEDCMYCERIAALESAAREAGGQT